VEDPEIAKDLQEILGIMLADNRRAWICSRMDVTSSDDPLPSVSHQLLPTNFNGNGATLSWHSVKYLQPLALSLVAINALK